MNVTFRFCFRSPLKSLKLPVFKGLSTDLGSHSFLHISFYPLYNNLDKRMEEHRCEDFEIVEDRVFAWNCENVDVATEVEKRLGKLGFDIGISRLWIKKNIYRVLLILCRPL